MKTYCEMEKENSECVKRTIDVRRKQTEGKSKLFKMNKNIIFDIVKKIESIKRNERNKLLQRRIG